MDKKQKFRDFKNNFASFTNKYFYGEKFLMGSDFDYDDLMEFMRLPLAVQWGVYEDFFEKNGIYPEVKDCHGHEIFAIDEVERYHATCCQKGGKYYALSFTNDKLKARQEAINKAIELYESTELLSKNITETPVS